MTYDDVLGELIAELRLSTQSSFITSDQVQLWPEDALDRLISIGLISPAPTVQSLECLGCEKHCFMDVHVVDSERAFIMCGDSEMQSQIGRVKIPIHRLKQWQFTIKSLSKVVAHLLSLKNQLDLSNPLLIKLGMLKSSSGRRWVILNCITLSLEINGQSKLLEELLFFDNQQLNIDTTAVDFLLNLPQTKQQKPYTPSTTKREESKRKTQAMYQDWQDAYEALKKQYPSMTGTWYSNKISKLDIAQGKSPETIRRQLKTK